MIVRIMGRGQVTIPDHTTADLTAIDHRLIHAIESDSAPAYASAMDELHRLIETHGVPVPDDHLGVSDIVVPEPGTTLEETHAMLQHGDLVAAP